MPDAPRGPRAIFLSEVPAGRGEFRLAATVVVCSAVIFLVLAPFAKVQLPSNPAFIPIYQSALFINDVITVVFLMSQSHFSRCAALSWLGSGYLFTALMSAAHALTFPGLFAPGGLLHAGPQTTAWLYVFWHAGFPLFVLAYAGAAAQPKASWRSGRAIAGRIGLVAAAVPALTLLATSGGSLLPEVMKGSRYAPAAIMVLSSVWILNLGALAVLSRRRPYSVLDLWLMVVSSAWLFDIALSAMFNGGRFDLGFYAGRIYGLIAASLVLVVLLCENGRLYLRLIQLHDSEREKAAELARLSTIDALTGIANRRALDESLALEWRRMMRHGDPLSLLLIDIDFFKRFNDGYGHVAGDQCLRAVAQAVASRARRAGEVAARYGGEEFAVLLPQNRLEDAARLGEMICRSVRELNILHASSEAAPYVTISVGVASMIPRPQHSAALTCDDAAPAGNIGPTVLVEAADHALYQAKTSGRNRVAVAAAADVKRAAAA